MSKKRLQIIALSFAGLFALYVIAGFFAVPPLIAHQLSSHVEQKLKHKLTLGAVHFNPLTFTLELDDFDLRAADGAALVNVKRLFANFQAISIFQRAWNFTELTLDSPVINTELRKDGSNNFTSLLAALRDPEPKPDASPPPLVIDRIKIDAGRIDIADLQAGDDARMRLAPIALELTGLSTLAGRKGPYKLSARTADGEALSWEGEISLNPIASSAKLALSGWKLATFTRLLGSRISIEKAAGDLDATLDYNVSFTGGAFNASVKDFSIRLSQLVIVPKGSSGPLLAADTLALGDLTFKLDERIISAKRFEFVNGKLALEVDADGRSNWAALIPRNATDPDSAQKTPATNTDQASTPDTNGPIPAEKPRTDPLWRIKLDELKVTDLGLKFADRRVDAEVEASFQTAALNMAVTAEIGTDGGAVTVENLKTVIDTLALAQRSERLSASQLELSTASIKANLKPSGPELDLQTLTAAVSALVASHASQVMNVQKVTIDAQALTVASGGEAKSAHRIGIEGAAIKSSGMTVRQDGAKADSLELGSLGLASKTIALLLGGESLDANADGLTANLAGVTVREPTGGNELVRLESAEASGGMLNLREHRAQLERIVLTNGHAVAAIAANGKLNWDLLLATLTGPPQQAAPADQASAKPAPRTPWKAAVKNVELRNFGGAFTDHRQTPALAVVIHDLNAGASNISTDPATPAQIKLAGRIKEGGPFAANGRVNLQTLATDLKLKLADLSLTPLQPFLAKYARLQINSALASAEGRLRYAQRKNAGADVLFEGNLDLTKVVIVETEPSQPFLSLDGLKAVELKLAIGPDRLDISELHVAGLATKLLIAEDQSVNLIHVIRRDAESAKPAPAPTAPTKPGAGAKNEFPIAIARIRIADSRLEFSDLSLLPQFTARMHELKGVVTGVSTAPDSSAQAELEARIDEFGTARIRGEMNPFKPRVSTDINMMFRNLEMSALTPYTAKFAGYRIAAGKLSMDLQYKIKDGALVGQNKIVLNKLALGERVQSPNALNLPLELAVAILKDSDGKIDIGLPVSGSLDDPKFNIGEVIGKAIGNLLTGIVTAPFRALAGLFGGSAEKLDSIEFDAGSDRLLPPERQKLIAVAQALSKRPQLKLTVTPTYAASTDRPALQLDAVRREITTRSGIKLQPGEAPGPIDFANSRTQQAVEAIFLERYSAALVREIKERLEKTLAPATEGTQPPAKPVPVASRQIARAMARQLIDAHPINDNDLTELAKHRGDAIIRVLREAGKLDPTRLATSNPSAVNGGSKQVVPTALDLGVLK